MITGETQPSGSKSLATEDTIDLLVDALLLLKVDTFKDKTSCNGSQDRPKTETTLSSQNEISGFVSPTVGRWKQPICQEEIGRLRRFLRPPFVDCWSVLRNQRQRKCHPRTS